SDRRLRPHALALERHALRRRAPLARPELQALAGDREAAAEPHPPFPSRSPPAPSSRQGAGGRGRAAPSLPATTAGCAVLATRRGRPRPSRTLPSRHDRRLRRPPDKARAAERGETEERRLAADRELRQQAREEDGDLRIAEVAEEALPERQARTDAERRQGTDVPVAAPRCRERLQAEEDEVGAADEPEREE